MTNIVKMKKPPADGYVIEKGIPIPKTNSGRSKGESKYPFLKMDVGDSVFVKETRANVVGAYTRTLKQRNNSTFKFICRTVEGGVRVWRIE